MCPSCDVPGSSARDHLRRALKMGLNMGRQTGEEYGVSQSWRLLGETVVERVIVLVTTVKFTSS